MSEPTPNAEAALSPLRFGFRRRCAWCGVVLRGWQLNLCRMCKSAVVEPCLRSSPCVHASRWDAEPDTFRRRTHIDGSGVSS